VHVHDGEPRRGSDLGHLTRGGEETS
jgi:hypothetical protein